MRSQEEGNQSDQERLRIGVHVGYISRSRSCWDGREWQATDGSHNARRRDVTDRDA